jgi:elongation factor Ts
VTVDSKPMISPAQIKVLRDQTGAGVMDCKRALEASNGDVDAAVAYLREQGMVSARNKAGREAREGVIGSYIHHGSRLGALVELNCETDFVARTDDFQQLARELAMQVAGLSPQWVSREDVPPETVAAQRERFAAEAAESGRPADRVDDIVTGKMDKWYESACLLEMPYRDTDRRIGDLITDKVALLGENIRVARFARLAVGESPSDDEQDETAPEA